MTELQIAEHWINGEWVESGRLNDSIDPATGEVIGRYHDAGQAEAEQAIQAARNAFLNTDWCKNRRLRSQVLNEMADRFEARSDELIHLLSTENGKVFIESAIEISLVAPRLRYYAAVALTDHGRALEVQPGTFSFVLREPVGVAGIIVPWNSPVILFIRALAPALAAGTTVVAKLPGQTAQVNALVARTISETVSLPAGVVNIFSEAGTGGAEALVDSPFVPVISFTGSVATARIISAAGAKRLKRFNFELGGKTPFIVFNDADIDALLPTLEKGVTVFAGQFCMTGSRLLVQRDIADRVRQGIVERLRQVKVGPASDHTSDMGPLIDKASVTRVDRMVDEAIAEGAKVLLRGGPIIEQPLAKGAFYRPTVLEVGESKIGLVQKEVFGPVLVLQVFDTEEEAVHLANETDYGLAASVWSRDAARPLRIATELQAGTVWINNWATIYDECEEGGFKQSGIGRLGGLSAVDFFLEYKNIAHTVGNIKKG